MIPLCFEPGSQLLKINQLATKVIGFGSIKIILSILVPLLKVQKVNMADIIKMLFGMYLYPHQTSIILPTLKLTSFNIFSFSVMRVEAIPISSFKKKFKTICSQMFFSLLSDLSKNT